MEEVELDDSDSLQGNVPFARRIKGITTQLNGQVLVKASSRPPIVNEHLVPFLDSAVNGDNHPRFIDLERREFLHLQPSVFAVGLEGIIDVRGIEIPQTRFHIPGKILPLFVRYADLVFMFKQGTGFGEVE